VKNPEEYKVGVIRAKVKGGKYEYINHSEKVLLRGKLVNHAG
jgi:hypothetical protein